MLAEAGFTDITLEEQPQMRALIAGWMPGSGAEEVVSTALYRATK